MAKLNQKGQFYSIIYYYTFYTYSKVEKINNNSIHTLEMKYIKGKPLSD